jgi:hypothetical protein
MSTPWIQVPEPGGIHGYTRNETYQPGTTKERNFYLFVEEIKGTHFNWKLTVSENDGILFAKEFYLGAALNTPDIAKQTANQIMAQYIKGLSP